jgi:hypothetical protein
MVPDLIKITELFLIPCSFLVAALGTADTNFHRAAVSLVGLVVSSLWMVCSLEALSETVLKQPEIVRTLRIQTLAWFPLVFIVGWLVSVVVHLLLLGRPLGQS